LTKQKVALVTGVTGQDGAYLSELLLNTQYKVYGLVRRSSTPNRDNISHFIDHANFIPFYGDLSDTNSLLSMLRDIKPDEIYNLGAQSDVGISFDIPVSTGDINALGTMRIIDCVRTLNLDMDTKIYQASTSELFGKVQETPQTEKTPFYPRSPYGVSKLYAYWAIKNYREAYGMFGCNGILFNHESPLRGENFVTRKITKAVAEMYARDRKDPIELGNMDAKRDWGHAKDYVKGMWQMMQEQESDDYILATGETHSIRQLVETAFKYIGETVLWGGTEKNEQGYNSRGDLIVKVNPDFYRPAEVDVLCGDPSKAEKKFGWERLYTFENLISEMVEEDIDAIYKNKR
jgi:GDPmannose 4,6-dehydratase